MMVALLLMACGPAELMDPMSPPQVEARVSLDQKAVGPGESVTLTTTLVTTDGWTGTLPAPEVEGLDFELADEASRRDDDRSVLIKRYLVSGEPDSYVIPSMSVQFSGPNDQSRELTTATLFLDLGVEGPTSALSELVMSPAPEPARWPYAVGALAAGMLLGGGIVFFLRKRGSRPEIVLPPHEILMRDWALVRDDPEIDDETRATTLSALFRSYLEAVTGVEATAMTTAETLEALDKSGDYGNIREDSKQILSATDLVKYAREGGGSDFFTELDEALVRVVHRQWEREAQQAAADAEEEVA